MPAHRPDLQPSGRARVVAPAEFGRGGQELVSALQAGGAAAHEFLAVVERQGRKVGESGVGFPGHHELDGLLDLRLPVGGRPGGHPVGSAEVPVEVGADLMAFPPGQVELPDGAVDGLLAEIADIGGAHRVLRRMVEVFTVLGQQVDAAEEEGHMGVVAAGHLAEAAEQPVAEFSGTVPGDDDELRWP